MPVCNKIFVEQAEFSSAAASSMRMLESLFSAHVSEEEMASCVCWTFLLVLILTASERAWAQDGPVIELDAANFDDGVADEEIMLVEFYAPWCGHCKRLAPEYETAAMQLATEDPPISLAKVDCPANSDLCGRFGVTGYPTLKIFRGGEFSADYAGPRSADGIVSYMKKHAGPSSREFDDVDGLNEFLKHSEHSIVGFFTDSSGKLAKTFKTLADGLRESFRFAHSTSEAVLTEFGYSDQVVIFQPPALHTKLEESFTVYDGAAKLADLKTFVKTSFMGIAGVRTPDNKQFFDANSPLAVVYYDVDYEHNPKGSNYWRNRVIKVAKDFVGEVNFAVSSKTVMGGEVQQFGIGPDQEVGVGLFDSNGRKYAMTEKFSVDSFREFITQFLAGELEPYIKSEPLPDDNSGPVTVVVGKNFDEVVNDDSKDVLIEFYAPWCGHCKTLAPKYEELGKKFENDPNIVIAKMDATANDYPSTYEARGYPTIYWAPVGKKDSPEKYEGGREVADFVDFLKRKATNPVVVSGEDEDEEGEKKSNDKEEL